MQPIQHSTTQQSGGLHSPKQGLSYSTVWRWHFYAGLFCLPFILWLSFTGLIYLFKPQIDQWIDRPYDHLVIQQQIQSPAAQVQAAIHAVPNSIFSAYELPPNEHAATRVFVVKDADIFKVYIHPETLQVLKIINQDDQFTRQIFRLHGEMMLGDNGSRVIEIAASWTIIMIITGVYLWLGKGGKLSIAGMLYPRLNRKGRAFWKDIHAVVGFWIALFTIFLLVSGLPWTASWGGMLKTLRQWSAPTAIQQDWTTSSREQAHHQKQVFEQAHHHIQGGGDHAAIPASQFSQQQNQVLNQLVVQASKLSFAYPVQITTTNQNWAIASQTQNRPLREKITFDATGQGIQHETFKQKPMLDRIIGYGVAIHEGRMFGWFNVAIGVFTVLGLILVSISGLLMWLKRKSQQTLGTPPYLPYRLSLSLKIVMVIFGVLLPLLGVTLIMVLLMENFIFSRIPMIANYLGLLTTKKNN